MMSGPFPIPRQNVQPGLYLVEPPHDHGELAQRLAELHDLKRAGTDTSATIEALIGAWEFKRSGT